MNMVAHHRKDTPATDLSMGGLGTLLNTGWHALFGGWAHWRRNRRWARATLRNLKAGILTPPPPPLVQILPTERCNLRCKMCNQWGLKGIYLNGRQPAELDPAVLARVLGELSASDPVVNIHGGEPFAYGAIDDLMTMLATSPLDVLFTTNGTLMGPHAEALARLRRAAFLISVDGPEASHDKIRGPGAFRAMEDGVRALVQATRQRSGRRPLMLMNCTVSEFTSPEHIEATYQVARRLGFLYVNFTLRWFVTEAAGHAFDVQLARDFGVTAPSRTWQGFVGEVGSVPATAIATALSRVLRHNLRMLPPFVRVTPRLPRVDAANLRRYFDDYPHTFGRKRCLYPFYAPRIHANGDVVYCWGFRDPVVGNVNHATLAQACASPTADRLRRVCLDGLLPVCSRCCGLFLAYPLDPSGSVWKIPAVLTAPPVPSASPP
jgi:sulfatase maturation enzyme AslB (radical SAM superfamily)